MDPVDIRSSFLRQRRNLMAISIVNLFVTLSGIKLDELDVLGNKFTIQNPHYISASLWIAFFYWLVRYFQLLHDSGNLGIRDKYHSMVFHPTALAVRPLFETYIKTERQSRNVPESTVFREQGINWKTKPSMIWPFTRRALTCEAKYDVRTESGHILEKTVTKDLELKPLYRLFLRSWFDGLWFVFAKSSLGTEYILPPLLAFSVLGACIVHTLN